MGSELWHDDLERLTWLGIVQTDGSRPASPPASAASRPEPLPPLSLMLLAPMAWLAARDCVRFIPVIQGPLALGLLWGLLTLGKRMTDALARWCVPPPRIPRKARRTRRQRALAEQRLQQADRQAAWLAAVLDPRRLVQTCMLSGGLLRLLVDTRLAALALAILCESPKIVVALVVRSYKPDPSAVCDSLRLSPLTSLFITAVTACFCWRLRARWGFLGCCLVFLCQQ